MKTITITIDNDAKVTVEANGFKGKSCKDATKFLTEALGTTKKTTLKPEYHQVAPVQQKLNGSKS